jgi:hypothetical protein
MLAVAMTMGAPSGAALATTDAQISPGAGRLSPRPVAELLAEFLSSVRPTISPMHRRKMARRGESA